jgi:uncharacterized membrane protein YecN with MAPEG domain
MSNLVMPVISTITAGLLLLLQTALMFAAAMQRGRAKQPIGGDSTDPQLLRAVRRHGNLAENAAIFLIGVALLEMMGGGRLWVESLCAAFVIARIAHAIALSMENTVNPFRIVGVLVTVVAGITLGIRLVLVGAAHLSV